MKKLINRSVLAVLFGVLLVAGSSSAKDVSLTDKVRHELNMLPYYGVFDAIAYEVNGDAVTLSGAVHYPVLASDAVNVVKHIPGVSSVSNQIEVLPLSRFDDQIRLAAWRTVGGVLSRWRPTSRKNASTSWRACGPFIGSTLKPERRRSVRSNG